MFIAQILGNIGRDAEVKTINGKEYISFSVASTEKENGEDVTRWTSVLASFNNRNIVEYLKKGQQVFVSGRYSDKMYTHQSGVGIDRQIFAGTIQLCGGKKEETQQDKPAPSMGNGMTGTTAVSQPGSNGMSTGQTVSPFPPMVEKEETDLPF